MPLPECTRLDHDDAATRERLLSDGWREIEVLETWKGLAPRGVGLPVYTAEKSDIGRLQSIALASFTEDRLHKDPLVAKEDADAAKAKWVSDAVTDYRRKVYVIGEPPDAFLSFFPGETIIIDLLAVHPDAHGRKIGTSLIIAACHDAKFVQAGTQSTNEAARSLYRSLGMEIIKRQRTFHR